jgi:hypothetical protein
MIYKQPAMGNGVLWGDGILASDGVTVAGTSIWNAGVRIGNRTLRADTSRLWLVNGMVDPFSITGNSIEVLANGEDGVAADLTTGTSGAWYVPTP